MGNLVAVMAGDGTEKTVTQYQYDTANRMTKMITGLSSYTENPTGGSATTYEYNTSGYLYKITDPLGKDEEFMEYDKYGNVKRKSDRNGNVFDYRYGAYGLSEENSLSGMSRQNVYNKLGQVTKTISKNEDGELVEESYTYDPFGRMTSMTSNDGTVQSYTYDNNSNVLTYSETKDNAIKSSNTYEYDAMNRLTKLSNDDSILMYTYDANGNLSTVTDGKRARLDIDVSYNKANLPTSYQTYYGGRKHDYNTSYFLNGQKYQENDAVNNIARTYQYTSVGQLKNELRTQGSDTLYTTYSYDVSGNRTRMTEYNYSTDMKDITRYTYDANNRLTQSTIADNVSFSDTTTGEVTGMTRYYYDDNGNTIAEQNKTYTTAGNESSEMILSGRSGGNKFKLYQYDDFNRLIQYNDGATEAKYTYSTNNLRNAKTVNGNKTEYVWNGQNLASETKNDVTTVYTYDRTGVITSKTDNDSVVRYVKDPHGNVMETSKNNSVFGEYDYTAFGIQSKNTDTSNPFRYCGEYYDTESDSVYLRNRYYTPSTGRFLTEDPIKDGLNWYVYCKNEPIMSMDANGLYATEIEHLMGAILRLTYNKINYQNYLNDYYHGTSYAGPYYSGPDQYEYYENKFSQIHHWANIERNKIRENTFLNENKELKRFMEDILSLEGGGSIEEVSTAMYIVDYYCKHGNNLTYEQLKEEYNKRVEENKMYMYDFPAGEYLEESKNAISGWLHTKNPPTRPDGFAYGYRKVRKVGIDVEQEDRDYANGAF